MLTEAMRPTCRISLAIIRSFSKFTRPSTLESFPDGGSEEYQLLARYAEVTKHMRISGAAINTYADHEPDAGRCLPGAN